MLVGSYNLILVVCSLLVAILASYTALGMAERMHEASNEIWWHIGGATAMGVGIWSMHFIGMLAFSLPIELGYDLGITFVSLLIAIAVSYFSLWIASLPNLTKRFVLFGAVLMGLGISAMHYVGMEAMRMFPAIQYKADLMVLSVVIAIIASYAALHIMLWMRERKKTEHSMQVLAATMMGVAIVGMHYTGMMAAEFPANSICHAAGWGMSTETLAIIIGMGSFVLFLISNLASIFDIRTNYLIQSLEEANQQLKTQALYDDLTKLPNRVLLEERVNLALKQASHNKHFIAFLAINLDGFKAINDSMGLKVGDAYLIVIAHRIRDVVDSQYTVSRTTGNEFVVILEQIAPEDAAVVAEKLINAIKQPLMLEGQELVTTASIGIAVSYISGNTYEDLAFHADAAMQHTKQTGKNGYHYYEDKMDVDAARKLDMISHLRHAVERNELSLHYQPKFDVKTGCVYSAEALLRWNDAEYGSVSPAEFIPLAEESGLIVDIGDWALHQACRQLKEWDELGYKKMNVAVNLSSIQFSQDGLYEKVISALEYWGVSSDSLTLEITESTAMHDVEHSLAVLKKLANYGVNISIDDFGTGYSSLLYLKRLPACELKIDRGFVKMLCSDSGDGLLVSVIVSLGHQFGLKVVAEGVETQEQKDMLRDFGCDTLQGFYLGKPKPAVKFFNEYRMYMKKYQEDDGEASYIGLPLLSE